ncbi:hypothetical protein [Bradyrhizobium uaiense]|uniref:Uncharacterized protein n=1 Tax=Bradyrhizobium uaiense TaxID=2594946 RepID=A0A6P1BWV5_9BRAD|nr:hypothetical protein [Bradyrhizobium uaiense]NEV02113.1 hypothetical protein [Bradyrhizobium uaiense]
MRQQQIVGHDVRNAQALISSKTSVQIIRISPRKHHRLTIKCLREVTGERVQAKLFFSESGKAVFSSSNRNAWFVAARLNHIDNDARANDVTLNILNRLGAGELTSPFESFARLAQLRRCRITHETFSRSDLSWTKCIVDDRGMKNAGNHHVPGVRSVIAGSALYFTIAP